MIELIINNTPIDFVDSDSLGFRLNKIIKSQADFGKSGGTFSSTIQLPYTANNAKVLNVFEINQFKAFEKILQYPSKILYGGETVIEGFVLVESLTNKSINVRFTGIDAELAVELEKYTLQDLDWSIPFDALDSSMVNFYQEGFNRDNSSNPSNVVFPFINYNGQPELYYNSFTGEDIFGTYDTASPPNLLRSPLDFPESFNVKQGYLNQSFGLTFRDMPPAVRYKHLLDKVFEKIGYTWNSSLKFESWFNKLFMPYVGEGYIWNWATLAELDTDIIFNRITPMPPVAVTEHYAPIIPGAGAPSPSPYSAGQFVFVNGMDRESAAAVINFVDKGWNVLHALEQKNNHYIVPQDGRYKLDMRCFYDFNLFDFGSTIGELDSYGNPPNEYGYGDVLFVMLRKSKDDEFILQPEIISTICKAMSYDLTAQNELYTIPSDVIAYFSPKRLNAYGITSPNCAGTPLMNFSEPITFSTSIGHNETSSPTERRATGQYTISTEADLKEGERIYFYAVHLIDLTDGAFSVVDNYVYNYDISCNINNISSEIDLNISRNLPPISLKTFVKSFANLFGLQFEADGFNKSVTFFTNNELKNARRVSDAIIDLTDDVDVDSITIKPCPIPTKITLGYTNDRKDINISRQIQTESDGQNLTTEYGNLIFDGTKNIYAENEIDLRSLFSSTRFINAQPQNVDVGSPVVFPNPLTSELFFGGWAFDITPTTLPLTIPTIQSIEQADVTKYVSFRRDFNYTPRLLYYLSADNPLNNYTYNVAWNGYYPSSYSPRIVVPTKALRFDAENEVLLQNFVFNPNSYPSLRFDSSNPNNLYNRFHKDYMRELIQSHDLEANVNLNWTIYRKLTLGKLVKIQDGLFEILEILDFDPTGENLAKIKLRKIV